MVELPSDFGSILRRTEDLARKSGDLQSFTVRECRVDDGGIRFIVRVAATLARKTERAATIGPPPNPFLPCDPRLRVLDFDTDGGYRVVLNKFNVVPHHLLIVTRRFQPQTCFLNPADFEIWAACLRWGDGLGFYNGGPIAGASQPHKHLQWVPLPLAAAEPGLPTEQRILETSTDLPWPGAREVIRPELWGSNEIGPSLFGMQNRLIARVFGESVESDRLPAPPFNLLLTRRWMLLVPRTRERAAGISINALGFAGSLFVPHDEAFNTLRRLRPLTLLRVVTGAEPDATVD